MNSVLVTHVLMLSIDCIGTHFSVALALALALSIALFQRRHRWINENESRSFTCTSTCDLHALTGHPHGVTGQRQWERGGRQRKSVGGGVVVRCGQEAQDENGRG